MTTGCRALAARDAADAVAEAEAQAAQAAAAEAEARRAAAVEAEAAALLAMAQAEAQAAAEAAEREAQAAAEREADEAAQREAAMAAVEADDPTLAFEPGLNRQLTSGEAPVEAEAEAGPAVAEPEPQLAVAEPDPIPDRAAASIEPIPTAIGQPIPASSIDGEVHWPDTQVAAAACAPWQGAPEPASTHADDATPEATATRGAGLPAADARVLPMAARACPSCGLSLSASARFCRRCGTPQQVDAPG